MPLFSWDLLLALASALTLVYITASGLKVVGSATVPYSLVPLCAFLTGGTVDEVVYSGFVASVAMLIGGGIGKALRSTS